MTNPHLISQEELLAGLSSPSLKLVDGSWYLPAQNRDARAEYEAGRIGHAVHFDIDRIADTHCDLPHMLPDAATFGEAVGALGLCDQDEIVVYDGPGLFSAARVWWSLRVMGAQNVRILDGGMDGWRAAGLPVETGPPPTPDPAGFNARFDRQRLATIEDVIDNLSSRAAIVLDARPRERFTGQVGEPRPGLKSGHIPASHSLPFGQLLENGRLKPREELARIFSNYGLEAGAKVITTCGSGVSAAILILGLETVGLVNNSLYDGSWAQWGQFDGVEVETGDAGT